MTSDRRQPRFPSSIWKPATHIARKLGETKAQPRYQIAAIIETCGLDFAECILHDTEVVEAQGGLLVPDGSRRTPGGVFFKLAKDAMTDAQRKTLFPPRQSRRNDAFRWTRRAEIVPSLMAHPGEVLDVQVMVIGRPTEVWEYTDVIILTMTETGALAPTPKGVPQPQLLDPGCWVLVAVETWQAVVSGLDDESAMLVIQGVCAIHPEYPGLMVHATQVALQAQKKRQRAKV